MNKGLNIGCGPVILETDFIEWENSDFADTEPSADWNIDKKRDFTKPMKDIDENSIDFIIAWHIIEHVGCHERDAILQEWLRVLRHGGQLFIACPDMTKIARHIVDRDGPWADWFICAVNVMGPYNGYIGDYHKWTYDFAELGRVLESNGFTNYQVLNQSYLQQRIGINNATKIGFADYNVQALAVK